MSQPSSGSKTYVYTSSDMDHTYPMIILNLALLSKRIFYVILLSHCHDIVDFLVKSMSCSKKSYPFIIKCGLFETKMWQFRDLDSGKCDFVN